MKRILIIATLLFSAALMTVGSAVDAQTTHSYRAPAAVIMTRQNTVYITRTGERFHRDSCRHLAKSKIAIKRKDAISQGYTPCKICKP
jgi:hypothetical protein